MKVLQLTVLAALAWLAWSVPLAAGYGHGYGCGPRVGWSVGFNVGPPVYYPRPWAPWWYYQPYPAYPVMVAAPPVIIQPAPVVVQPAPALAPAPITTRASPVQLQPVSVPGMPADAVEAHLQQLTRGEDNLRRDAVLELGRLKAERAVDALCATLAGDRSPLVREAAAQGLGLIASPKALPALTRAAQADSERDVRRTAQFAIEIIHANLRRN